MNDLIHVGHSAPSFPVLIVNSLAVYGRRIGLSRGFGLFFPKFLRKIGKRSGAVCYTVAEELNRMPKRRAFIYVMSALVFLLAAPLQALAAENTALFEEAYAAWHSPREAGLNSGAYALHTGDSAFVPDVAPEVTPYDEETTMPSAAGYTFSTSDAQIVSVDETGLMTGVSDGTATVTCVSPSGAPTAYTVTVSETNLPERAKAFVYVARREYLKNQRKFLPKANAYTIWYYHSKKEVGWCSVFTIWCANASGADPIDEQDAEGTPDDAAVFFREGQVGNQYDGFLKLNRFVGIPRPGYLVIYANMKNAYLYTHVGIVTGVTDLSGGLYRVTTAEGNMSSTVKCYTFLYDSNADNHLLTADTRNDLRRNMSAVPEEDRTDPLTQYELATDYFTVFGFGATWL